MGHKVHPTGMRLAYIYNWDSQWVYHRKKEYTQALMEDIKIRNFLKNYLHRAAVSKIVIERMGKRMRINIYTARPGIVIGKGGAEIERLREHLSKIVNNLQIHIDIHEIAEPELDAHLLAEGIARQIERQVAFRRAMKRAVALARRYGAQGVKASCAGRLAGAEIARCEWYREGRVPLQTFRADIDYGFAEALTKYGKIGVKVWIFKGEVLPSQLPSSSEDKKEDVDAQTSEVSQAAS